MTPEQALARGTTRLDEATENLTFGEYGWALEETVRAMAWVLNAFLERPRQLDLGPIGDMPDAEMLLDLRDASATRPAGTDRRVDRLVKLAVRTEPGRAAVEQAVFDVWETHDACGRHLRVADDRLQSRLVLAEVSPGRVGSQQIRRRTALKLLAASTVLPLQACEKVEQDNRPVAAPATPAAPEAEEPTIRVSQLDAMHWKTADPFLFCAHHFDEYPQGNDALGPAASLEGRPLGRDFQGRDNWRMYHGRTVPGFPRHPHRGFETVTVVRTGMLDHSDSMGAAARYGSGDVQWLTAGGGIQHAEMFPLLEASSPNPLELFQIWLNLPRRDKMVDPYFTMLWNERIPRVTVADSTGKVTEVTVAAGTFGSSSPPSPPPNSWASKAESELAIWSVRMEPGATFKFPAVSPGTIRSLYVHQGAGVSVAGEFVGNRSRVEVEDPPEFLVVAGEQEVEMLLLQGRPIGEPVAKRGPFVMNTQTEIRQAYADYQRTQFGGWPWERNDPVHQRTKGRFARHIDGKFEEPT